MFTEQSSETPPDHLLAGAVAHNRWLAELCATSPARRRGVAIVPIAFIEPEVSVAEIRRAHGIGLRGGILIPPMWARTDASHRRTRSLRPLRGRLRGLSLRPVPVRAPAPGRTRAPLRPAPGLGAHPVRRRRPVAEGPTTSSVIDNATPTANTRMEIERRTEIGYESNPLALLDEPDHTRIRRLIAQLQTLYMAGHEPVTAVLANGMIGLLDQTDQLARLQG